jgi:hypothetical protein
VPSKNYRSIFLNNLEESSSRLKRSEMPARTGGERSNLTDFTVLLQSIRNGVSKGITP